MKFEPIDYRPYILSLRITGPLAKPLSQKLVNAAPEDLDESERAALARVVRSAALADEVRSERERLSPAKIRPLVSAIGASFGPMHDALLALSRLAPQYGDRGPRAQRVLTSIFPDGMMLVTLEADAVWSEADRRLGRIDAEGMRAEIDALIGPEHLIAAREATAALGEALGNGTTKRVIPSTTALQRALNAFSRAVANYCRTLSANLDDEDEAKIDRFRRAVGPIDDYRAAHPVGAVEESEDEDPIDDEPTEPQPPVTPPPA